VHTQTHIVREDRAVHHPEELVGSDAVGSPFAAPHAKTYRRITLEPSILAQRQPPDVIGIACGNVVVRASKSLIGANPEVSPTYKYGSFAAQGTKRKLDQVSISAEMPSSAWMISLKLRAEKVNPGRWR
jgi:hypothetical protein